MFKIIDADEHKNNIGFTHLSENFENKNPDVEIDKIENGK